MKPLLAHTSRPKFDPRQCPECGGGGYIDGEECPNCDGTGDRFGIGPTKPNPAEES